MQLEHHVSLKSYNTFGIDVKATSLTKVHSIDELAMIDTTALSLVLGGGSNILFTQDVDGLVLINEITGIKKMNETASEVWIKAGGGEVWHSFVEYCIDHGYAGLENLALIPGSVGASPIQNIGAYGVEVKDVIEAVEAWDLEQKTIRIFNNSECAFGYRDSIFKRALKNKYIICSVTFRLQKQPVFKTSYGAIQEELNKKGITHLSIRAIADAVIAIRTAKLPDPKQLGNAGSFFKNPEIDPMHFERLKQTYANIVGYPVAGGNIKLAAGWLIEQAGWKGYRNGNVGVHHQQALVLVNYGGATGKEIFQLSEDILRSVHEKFNVLLEREVNIL